jgi:hypothetical protein
MNFRTKLEIPRTVFFKLTCLLDKKKTETAESQQEDKW